MSMKQASTIAKTIHMGTKRLGNASMRSNPANAANESVGLQHSRNETYLPQ
jgi:hypothetical protein